jgi:hypothetical protein
MRLRFTVLRGFIDELALMLHKNFPHMIGDFDSYIPMKRHRAMCGIYDEPL